ncbi:hypothetical protein [Arthrobacter sp. Br18]|uniref:hypothetical protein n=1 Tax=Arthrobacter sp. Br18 TaxID=1312954 RepID=UPI00047D0CE8|nr:hypothetical protein [Arthrobacter sp. Br18]
MKTTPSIAETTPAVPAAQATSQRSIWKEDPNYRHVGLHDGPSSRLNDIGFHIDARYKDEEGVTFFANLERNSEAYTLAEMKKIHRHLGHVLDKIAADPKPHPAMDTLGMRGGDRV